MALGFIEFGARAFDFRMVLSEKSEEPVEAQPSDSSGRSRLGASSLHGTTHLQRGERRLIEEDALALNHTTHPPIRLYWKVYEQWGIGLFAI